MSNPTFRSKYDPARGGHAPGDLRDVFCEAVETYQKSAAFPRAVTLREQRVPLAYVCALLRNCVDVLPRSVADTVEDLGLLAYTEKCPAVRAIPFSYAGAARFLKATLAKT